MSSNEPAAPKPPQQWPAAVQEAYEPVRPLGQGGFASVMLARRKNPGPVKSDNLVGIKIVGGRHATAKEVGYAHREIDILKELTHPRIVRLLDWWEPAPEEHKCAAVMALSYVRGPTLEYVLESIGAPALNFCRVITAQLVDVVAFLHSHAVIHRDIKPDNMIITGVTLQQDELYEDAEGPPNWDDLRKKWHLTLLDFGFSRPLGPGDVELDIGLKKSMHGQDMFRLDASSHDKALDKSLHDRMVDISLEEEASKSGRSLNKSGRSLDRSYSRVIVRRMSALGNQFYAAPEVKNNVKDTRMDLSKSGKPKNTLSNFVSDYGLVSDAFSVAQTIRYLYTGVPPYENIDQVIRDQKNPINQAARFMCQCLVKPEEETLRKKTYRKIKECPPEVVHLVLAMSNRDPSKRLTVRTARMDPWIDDVLESTDEPILRDMNFLQCTLEN